MTRPCRRRPLWAARATGLHAVSAVADLLGLHEQQTAKRGTRRRGVCPHCGRHIGRGVAMHAKWCARKKDKKERKA